MASRDIEKELTAFEKVWEGFDFSKYGGVDLDAMHDELVEKIKAEPKKNFGSFIAANLKNAGKVKPESEVYIFRSLSPCTKVVQSSGYVNQADGHGGTKRITDPGSPPIKCKFDNCSFVLNKAFAEQFGLTVKAVYDIMVKFPDYGKDYICISGPGVVVDSREVKRYMSVSDHRIKVAQGML